MRNDTVYISNSVGVLAAMPGSQHSWSNHQLIATITARTDPLNVVARLHYPSATTVTVAGGVPEKWKRWNVVLPKASDVAEKVIILPEYNHVDRLTLSRSALSMREKALIEHSDMRIGKKGRRLSHVPPTIEDAFIDIVQCVYASVERHSTSSMKVPNTLSTAKRQRLEKVVDIITADSRSLVELALIDRHLKVSTTMIIRYFWLCSIFSPAEVDRVIKDAYISAYGEQLDAVLKCHDTYGRIGA